ncbi:double zinc ribbon protein [Paenibacillus cellulosilyticus]|uniref:Double zinc ribbon protein n=1 Tax=Paenibacillus cellulosilyticus TaxID=375489 RepID=A0A2V2YPQ3_9BACL|nr:zinc ribbon domain-containing protein [Paenibacillus cellulosilyticus]PWV97334.1 double zinc ribbon protein [Paenibacillus cellulosilyticus]QKS47466.1 zinc ribbon domain-containing protein [Paenibacillus cellulosilyticus]
MSIFDKMKQGASDAARKAQQTLEIAKLNNQKSSREKDMSKLYSQIGEAVFEAHLSGEHEASAEIIEASCEKLKIMKQEIEMIDHKIQSIKLEKSCTCGTVVPLNAKFCPDCGTRFATEQELKSEMTSGEIRVICPNCDTENELMARYCTDCGHELGKMRPTVLHSNAQVVDPELETYVDPDPVVEVYEEKDQGAHDQEDQLKRREEGNNGGWGRFSFDKYDDK